MFTPADVSKLVGRVMFARGEEYFATGQVVTVARNGDGATIVGQVRGSGRKQYVTVVEMSSSGDQATPRYGRCSCPVQLNCKHAAATLLAYLDKHDPAREARAAASGDARSVGRPAPRPTAEWERTFAAFLAVPDDDAPSTQAARPGRRLKPWDERTSHEIALQFELQTESTRAASRGFVTSSEPRIAMRPVTRSGTGRWVRTGVSWSELRFLSHRHGAYPDGHVDVLRSLFGLASSVSDAAYFSAPTWVHTDEIPSTALWSLLADARRVGLPLVQSDKAQTPLSVSATPARTRLSVARAGAGLALSAQVVHDDSPLDPNSMLFIGTPPTGLATWSSRGPLGKEARLLLAQCASPIDETVLGLLDRPDPLTVPASDERRFLTRVYPALCERFDNVKLDPAITLPERPRPRLRLDVAQLPEHATSLTWQWSYTAYDEDGEPLPVSIALDATRAPVFRDFAAEAAVLDRLCGRSSWIPQVRADGVVVPAAALSVPRGGSGEEVRRDGVGHADLHGVATALFFTQDLPGLRALAAEDTDFALDVRSDGVDVDYRLTDDVTIAMTASTLPETRDWFDLAVTIKAGQQSIPFADVFRALAEGKKYILLTDGLHFTLDDERFLRLRDLIEEARAMQDTMGPSLRVSRFQVALFDELVNLGVVDGQAQAWREALGGLTDGATPQPLPSPAGFTATMRAYQQEGFEWLAFLRQYGLGGVLADDMGLGKTIQALALMQHDRATPLPGEDPRRPFLVVAPTSVVGNWVAEAGHFAPDLAAVAITETRARRRTPLAEVVAGADVVVTSYALFRLGFDEYEGLPWAGLVLDEAQFIKNHQSVAYQCARRLAAPLKIALTGTPLENNLMELWSILSVVSPGLFPSPQRFKEYYSQPIEKEHDSGRLRQLRQRVGPFMLRRTKEEVAKDLPAKQEQIVDVVLNSRHRALYERYLQRERTKVLGLVEEFGEHRFEVFRSLTVLRQASLDVTLVDSEHEGVPSSKLEVLYEMLDDILAEGHSVLVFSQFTQFLGRVRAHLDGRGVDYSYLDGRTRKRAETIERFTSGQTKVFLISLKAGGFGLNLTAADYCILLDPWWNPAAEAQAVDRAHRIGQKRNVMVYRMVSTDTIEEKVMALKASKSKLFASVLDGGAAGGTGLTAKDVRELLG